MVETGKREKKLNKTLTNGMHGKVFWWRCIENMLPHNLGIQVGKSGWG